MKYKALTENIFSGNNYSILPIEMDDIESIRQWRNSQMEVLRQKKEISVDQQLNYFHAKIEPLFNEPRPTQLLFSFKYNEVLIGYGGLVNISWEDKRAEMSFLVDPQRAINKDQYALDFSNFISLIKELCFGEMHFNRLFTETYEFREFHISILEKSGFNIEGRFRKHIFEHGKFHDSILHSILEDEYVKK